MLEHAGRGATVIISRRPLRGRRHREGGAGGEVELPVIPPEVSSVRF